MPDTIEPEDTEPEVQPGAGLPLGHHRMIVSLEQHPDAQEMAQQALSQIRPSQLDSTVPPPPPPPPTPESTPEPEPPPPPAPSATEPPSEESHE